MKSNDIQIRSDVREAMQKAIRENDNEAFYASFEQMLLCIKDDIENEYNNRVNNLESEMDRRALASRGVRQLTSEERTYYQKLAEAMKAKDPKQALNAYSIRQYARRDSYDDEYQRVSKGRVGTTLRRDRGRIDVGF